MRAYTDEEKHIALTLLIEICKEKKSKGLSNIYDSDVMDISVEMNRMGYDIGPGIIWKILEDVIKSVTSRC